jgi:hypothetical protein
MTNLLEMNPICVKCQREMSLYLTEKYLLKSNEINVPIALYLCDVFLCAGCGTQTISNVDNRALVSINHPSFIKLVELLKENIVCRL